MPLDIDESAFDSEEPAAQKRRVPLSLAPYMVADISSVEFDDDITGRRQDPYKKPIVLGVPEPEPKAKKSDYNEKTRELLKARGYHPYRADYFDARTQRAIDFMGIFDFLALGNGETLGVQITSKANLSARRKKMLESGWAQRCRAAGWKLVLIGWHKENGRWTETWMEL